MAPTKKKPAGTSRRPNLVRGPLNAFPNADRLLRASRSPPTEEGVRWLVDWILRRAHAVQQLRQSSGDDVVDALTDFDAKALNVMWHLASEFEAGATLFKVGSQSVRLIDLRLEAARRNLVEVFRAEQDEFEKRSRAENRTPTRALSVSDKTRRIRAVEDQGLTVNDDQRRVITGYVLDVGHGHRARDLGEAAEQLVSQCWRKVSPSVRKRLESLSVGAMQELRDRKRTPDSAALIETAARALGADEATVEAVVDAWSVGALNRVVRRKHDAPKSKA